ncbi:ADP-ribose pyrophosphatase YjhB, NUDIX family [Glycomyces sambucus]|uniref:ADP-ribose pyrophosphatase YjhB, NUDIX family n=1 Tax=Glycomyces sambucus TaxID=380244 RepID=A0A1G9GV19_9ACTN|nr:NUDIX domain-containing protein [Glycomyces sambucus]SDL04560.1 ADP-ribose pyrophosphatase YjhB, NUDIX family [Glycomyces sambucus]
MSRIDHINNPDAPPPNSVVPSAVAFIENEHGEVLLIKRSDNGDWALPGGAHDLGESIEDTAVREANEETGLDIEVTGLIGVYTNPNHLIEYGDGEVRQQFSLNFRATAVGGEIKTSSESTQVRWFGADDLDGLSINSGMQLRIQHGFEHRATPYLG